jgi:hypothetical protein
MALTRQRRTIKCYGRMAPPFWTEGEFRYGFWSIDCNEPPHVHVEYRSSFAKFWIDKPGDEPVQIKKNHQEQI